MIALDTNVLVYAHRQGSPHHPRAHSLLKTLTEGSRPWALPVFCLSEFCRVVTHPRVFHPPTSLEIALSVWDQVVSSPAARLLLPGLAFPSIFSEIAVSAHAVGNLAFDAQIVAVCFEHGVQEIVSFDHDFDRFAQIRRIQP